MPDPEWLIEGILPANKLSVVYGASGTGKSFLTLDWGLSIATGTDWQGYKVKQGAVAYIAAEKGTGYKYRIQAWFQHAGLKQEKDLPFVLVDGPVSLFRIEELEEFYAGVGSKLTSINEIQLVVVDTLARCMSGGTENSNDDEGMGLVVAAADTIRRATGAQVLLVHHSGKGFNASGPRGGYALTCGVDTQIKVAPKKDGTIGLTCEKQSDAEEFAPLVLRKQSVLLAGGDTSLVLVNPSEPASASIVNIAEAPSALRRTRRPKKVSADQVRSFAAAAGKPITPREVSDQFLITLSAAQRHLRRLTQRKDLTLVGRGSYRAASSHVA